LLALVILFLFQFPIALLVFGYEAVKLYREHKRRMSTGNSECICGASIEWTVVNLAFCAICGIVGGVVGGLLGSGGGFVLGPLLLEIGVIPQVHTCALSIEQTRLNLDLNSRNLTCKVFDHIL